MKRFLLLFLLPFFTQNLFGADRYWVGGTGTWNASSTTNWSASSGGASGASVPTSSDNVYFDGSSGLSSATVTIGATANCLDFTWSTAAGTLAGTSTLNIFGSISLNAGMTITYTGTIEFEATSTGKTVTSAGKQFQGKVSFKGSGGGWTLQDAFSTTGELEFTAGTLTTNNVAVTCKFLDCSSSTTRTLDLGSSSVTINAATSLWPLDLDGSNFTLTRGTSSITFSFTTSNTFYIDLNGKSLYNVTFPSGDYEIQTSGSCTFNNLTIGAGCMLQLTSGTTHTVEGTFSADGDCSGGYVLLKSSTSGSLATLDFPNGAQSCDNVIVQDITASTNTVTCTDCVDLTATDGTFSFASPRASRNLYWIGGTGNYSAITEWSTSSGGANDVTCSPNSLDNVYFNGSSFTGSQTVTLDKVYSFCNNMDWTGVTNTPTLSGYEYLNVRGNIKLLASGTMSVGGNFNLIFESSANPTTIDTKGHDFYNVSFLWSGTYTLESDLDVDYELTVGTSATLDVLPNGGVAGTDEKNINVEGPWTNNGTFVERANSSAWVTLDGAGIITNDETFYNLKVNTANTSTGHYVYGSNVTVTNNFTMTAGKFNFSPSGAKTFASSNQTIIDGGTVYLSGSSMVFTAANDIDINGGTLEMDAGTTTITGNIDSDGGKVQMDGGTMTINGTGGIDGIDLANSGEFEVNGGTVNVGNGTTENLTIAGGVLDVNSGTVNVKANMTMTSGTLEMGGGTVNASTAATSGPQVNLTGGTYNLTGGTIDIKNTTTGGAGTCLSITGGTTVGTISGGTVKVSATNANGQINVAASRKIYNLEIASTGVTIDLDAAIDIDAACTLTSGTFQTDNFNITLGGNWTNNGGTFTEGTSRVTFDGGSAQTIAGSSAETFYAITASNASGITITTGPTITNDVTFSSGDITAATSSQPIIFDVSATATTAADGSHVVGYCKKNTNSITKFTFPVGDGTAYRSLAVTPAGGGDTNWNVKYFTTGYGDYTLTGGGINHVSQNEYWTIDRAGTSPVNSTIELSWDANSDADANYAELIVAHYNGADWQTCGGNSHSGNGTAGTLSSDAGWGTYSPFTLASTTANNPLPVTLLSFRAAKLNNYVDINWSTSSEINNDYFTIERSSNGEDFETIGTVKGAGNSNAFLDYYFNDEQPLKGVSYYRLKQTDFDGKYSHSDIAPIFFGETAAHFTVYPNPSNGELLKIALNSEEQFATVKVDILNLLGERIFSQSFSNTPSLLQFENKLLPGVYSLRFIVNGASQTIKFIVQ